MQSCVTTPMMETESVSKLLDFMNFLLLVCASENFIEFRHCESFKTHKFVHLSAL